MNRRHFPRSAFSGPVLLDYDEEWSRAQARDVSIGGMCIESELPLPLDRDVEVYFELNGVGIEALAHVVHHHGSVYGLAFDRKRKKSNPPHRYSFRPAA